MRDEAEKIRIDCDVCEAAVVAGTAESDPAIREHLSVCEACREFARFQNELLALEMPVSDSIPSWSTIKRKADQHKQHQRNVLRLILVPMGMAAAIALTVSVVIFDVPQPVAGERGLPEAVNPVMADNSVPVPVSVAKASVQAQDFIASNLEERDAFVAAIENDSISLAWDQSNNRMQTCVQSMQAARSGGQWSIEVFNPYSEDL